MRNFEVMPVYIELFYQSLMYLVLFNFIVPNTTLYHRASDNFLESRIILQLLKMINGQKAFSRYKALE